jgi:hypothetical protein
MQEAEWSGGAPNCPNIYSNIVLTLPATATYYTYQLSLTFINSALSRTLTDITPLRLESLTDPTLAQTENGTALSEPIVSSNSGYFRNYNYPSSQATLHHWSQLTWSGGTKGTGIMFTDAANTQLYAFDSAATGATGSLNVDLSESTIELSAVTQSLGQVSSFPTPNTYEVTWNGAVVTFDGTAPIFGGSGQPGLWVLAELPPTIAVVTGN